MGSLVLILGVTCCCIGRTNYTYEQVNRRRMNLSQATAIKNEVPPNITEDGRFVMVGAINTPLVIPQEAHIEAASSVALLGDINVVRANEQTRIRVTGKVNNSMNHVLNAQIRETTRLAVMKYYPAVTSRQGII